jgi:regulatory protein
VIPGNDSCEADDTDRLADPVKARKKAMDCLARREYGRAELVNRLVDGGFDPDAARAAVERLAAEGLQDDRRFATSLIRSRIRQGKGPVRIRLDLTRRGIDPALVESALAESGEDWEKLARRVRQRKFGAGDPGDFREKARQMRFLQYRGFEADQIAAAMDL